MTDNSMGMAMRQRTLRWLQRIAPTLVAILIGPALTGAQSITLTPANIQSTKLDNGLEVVSIRSPTAPIAVVVVVMRAGGFTQSNELSEGIPHLIEHLLYKSYDRSAGQSWNRGLADVGSLGFNGGTGEELVMYYVIVPPANVPKALKLLSDLVRNPKFDAKDMVTEVPVVRNELERKMSNEQNLLEFTVDRALWNSSWNRKNVGGNVFALLKATPTMLDSLYHLYYTPNNTSVIVSGDIAIADVMSAAKGAFGSWKKGPENPLATATFQMTPLAATVVTPVSSKAADITLQIAWQGPSAQVDSVGAMSADLFAAFLNNRNSSFQRALLDGGLFQSVHLDYRLLNHVGPIRLTARTTAAKVIAASAALKAELAKLSDAQAISESDVTLAKKYWRVENALAWERGATMAFTVADHWSVAGLNSWLNYGDGIKARTVTDVRSFVQQYIAGKPKVVGVLVSPMVQASLGRDFQMMMGSWNSK